MSKEKKRKITCAYNHLVIEFIEYSNFTEFKECIEEIYNSFLKIYNPLDIRRLGLRYINNINLKSGNPFDFKNFIKPNLTCFVDNFFDEKKDLSRVMGQVSVNKDDFRMTFTYGWYNSEHPSKISRKEFVLDYDCYTKELENQNILELITKFNKQIKYYFEQSIDEKLRKEMGVLND